MIVIRKVESAIVFELKTGTFSETPTLVFLPNNGITVIKLHWNLVENRSMMDWIGLFDEDSSRFFEHRSRLPESQAHLQWSLRRDSIPDDVERLYFGYIDGLTGSLLARSTTLLITKRAQILIQDVSISSEISEKISFSIGSREVSKSTDRISPLSLPFLATNSLSINCGGERITVPLEEIANLSSDLCISLATSCRQSFTLSFSVSIRPQLEEMTSVTPSTSGSSMSQTSSSSNSTVNLDKLPQGWEAFVDRTGRTFYVDHVTKKTSWQPPPFQREQTKEIKRYSVSRRTVTLAPSSETTPAERFLRRDDFFTLLHENQKALSLYNLSALLRHMVQRVRHGELSAKFDGQKVFLHFVNSFADTTQPLPSGWQASATQPTVFIDHGSKSTTLIDPRLPNARLERTRSAPPTRRRDRNGNDILRQAAELAPRLRHKLRLVERLGHLALGRLANDLDLAMALSVLDEEEQGESSELEQLLTHFYSCLHRSGYGCGPQKIKLRFSRSNLLKDAFDQILPFDPFMLKRARLSIVFDDEDGLDYGGPSRELFFLLSRELFNPYHGLFQYTSEDSYTVSISQNSELVENYISWFELAGRILGLALLHRCLVDTFFSAVFYRTLLEQPVQLEDLSVQDPQFYNSLAWLRSNAVDETLGLTFVATEKINGTITEHELLPNGAELAVCENNKEEFVAAVVRWRAERGVAKQTRALLRGLHQIIDRDYLRLFSCEQLELVLSGSVDINLDDWRANTEYKGGYYDDHVVIEWFWSAVEQMTNADRLQVLQFVTGTSSVPFEGFSMLRGSSGLKKFTIEKWGEETQLPRAHTCFNRLDLPSYPTKHVLRAKLSTAIHEGIHYAIE